MRPVSASSAGPFTGTPGAQELAKTASAKRFCHDALALQKRLFRLWHRYRGDPTARGGPITREQLITKALPIEQAFFALGDRYVNAANTDVSNLARALFVHNQHFFTFVHEDGVEPTNNVERALRTACNGAKSCSVRGASTANAPSNAC
jgi:hypothetical protein